MAKRIAFIGDNGATYEAIPYLNTYPTGVITIAEDTTNGRANMLSRFEKSDVSDSFDEKGICQIYRNGIFNKYLIFDAASFHEWSKQGGYDVYIWEKVPLSDTQSEQTFLTGSGYLKASDSTFVSEQAALPTFSGNVRAAIGNVYQDRGVYISTKATVSGGNVSFGLTMQSGVTGTPYADIIVIQLKN